jgi:hypothetical protein
MSGLAARLTVLAALLFAAPLAAWQGEAGAAPAEERVQRVFQIRWADTNDVMMILNEETMGIHALTLLPNSRQVMVEARPDVLERVEEWLRQVDVPPNVAVVRIILERAERESAASAGGDLSASMTGWTNRQLAETTFEIPERGEVRQAFGPDGVFELRVSLGSVDLERRLMHFDRLAVSRRVPAAPGSGTAAESSRELLQTSFDLRERVGRTVMAASDESADVALIVKAVGVIRESRQERR